MKRHSGVTLIEVVAAIFITGVGLLALLTLFPLGALNMAQAIKDDRTAHAAANAQTIHNLPLYVDTTASPPRYLPLRYDPLVVNAMNGADGKLPPRANGPGYPVFVDPVGVLKYGKTPAETWVAGQAGGIPRRTMSFLTVNQMKYEQVIPWCVLLDDLSFNTDG